MIASFAIAKLQGSSTAMTLQEIMMTRSKMHMAQGSSELSCIVSRDASAKHGMVQSKTALREPHLQTLSRAAWRSQSLPRTY